MLHLGDLVAGTIESAEFFTENYITEGPGLTAWVNLLAGEPLVIMLDEPPYLVNPAATSIGNADLATVTTARRSPT